MLKGISVTLYEKTKTGSDGFNAPIYEEKPVTVENVLVGEPSGQEIVNDLQFYGKKAVYTLAIPKGDTHNWENCRVDFFGQSWRTFGKPTQGIEDMIPLQWNKKVKVESYE